jgi:hypothetical protein
MTSYPVLGLARHVFLREPANNFVIIIFSPDAINYASAVPISVI